MSDAPFMLAIGDSHAQFWTGQDKHNGARLLVGVEAESVGPALAYNIAQEGTTTGGLERVRRVIENRIRRKRLAQYLMFCFGEIDLRAHLFRHVRQDRSDLTAAVHRICDRYVKFLEMMQHYDRPVLVFGPPASQPDGCSYNPNMPVVGGELERNQATILFHRRMSELAEAGNFRFLSILKHLLEPDGRTIAQVLYDKTHLGQCVMPVALDELERVTGHRPSRMNNEETVSA